MIRRATRKFNQAAIASANAAVFKLTDPPGRPLDPCSAKDAHLRKIWMDAYVAAKGKVEFISPADLAICIKPPCPKCCCCVTSVQIENVRSFGAEGIVSPNTGMSLSNGHIFDFHIEMSFAAGTSGTSDCVMEWWEKVNIPAIPGHPPNTWTDMFSLAPDSPTFGPWVRRTVPCPGGGPLSVVIHDPPSLGNPPHVTQTRTLEFRLTVRSASACSCGKTSATATATQVLEMVDGSLVAAGTSFTIGASSSTP